jgi:hypothetical protein
MNKILDDYLCNKYPKIFADRNKPPTETCMCWGFSHQAGWFFLINYLCQSIQSYIDSYNKAEPNSVPQVVADQVKEKFGSLRFYFHGGNDEIHGMVLLAENLSYHICEKCGHFNAEVTTQGKRWVRSLCPLCRNNPLDAEPSVNPIIPIDNELLEVWKEAKKNPDQDYD